MPTPPLRELALLYLAMAHRDDEVSSSKLDTVVEALHAYYPGQRRADVQDLVLDVLAAHLDRAALDAAANGALDALRDRLTPAQRDAVLADMSHIARSDGVVLGAERRLLDALAVHWGTAASPEAFAEVSDWDVLHHLAFVYLALAHGTDADFSDGERHLLLRKLREWSPGLSESEVAALLGQVLDHYAETRDVEAVRASVDAVKAALPPEQRMAALHDLIQIANADGVFLDREEDLINELVQAWEVNPYANYGKHGSKTERLENREERMDDY